MVRPLFTIFFLVVAFSVTGCSSSSPPPLDKFQSGALTIQVSMQPDPPKLNGNSLFIKIMDSENRRVVQAHVSATFTMPAMAAMAAMSAGSTVTEQGNGLYKATFDLPVEGPWTLDLKIQTKQGTIKRSYLLTAGRKGLSKLSEEKETAPEGVITVSEGRRQLIGVRIGVVEKKPMILTLRSYGNVTYDERRLNDVVLRVKGWIHHLDANFTGKRLKKGERLFTLYSPDLYATQQEYLRAFQTENEHVRDKIAQRLRLWGISESQIKKIAKEKKSFEYMPIVAPANGYIVEKNVIEGDFVEPGQKLMRIADLDEVWVEAEIYQNDLSQVHIGDLAIITLPYQPGKTYEGRISFIYPFLSGNSRTAKVRITLPNPHLELRPGMYANVELKIKLGKKLQVPESAVMYTGSRRIVFLDLSQGHLKPQEIIVGLRNNNYFEVLSGLKEGDRVVTSGNFLIASESQIRSALNYWGDESGSK